jgi:hypothetical protein
MTEANLPNLLKKQSITLWNQLPAVAKANMSVHIESLAPKVVGEMANLFCLKETRRSGEQILNNAVVVYTLIG